MPRCYGQVRTFLTLTLCLFTLQAAELPVKQVTLYKHGIGFFERVGAVPGGEDVFLDFKNSEMKDVLKSLIITASAGGAVSAVRYDSNATLEQQLNKYPFAVGDSEVLSAFLDRLKGAHLEIKLGDRTLTGMIMSARALRFASEDKHQAVTEQLTLLLDSGDLANFDLAAITSFHLLDARLQQQLKEYLETVAQAKVKDKRRLYLPSSPASRDLRLTYIAPTAIWKSSYRLTLAPQKSTLEGWAIVDNASDQDWNNVRLSVVSGRPISFISMLDAPRYGNRQVAELPEDRAAGPMVYSGAMKSVVTDGLLAPGAGLAMNESMGAASTGGRFNRSNGTHLGTGNAPVPQSANEFTRLEQYAQLQSSIQGATGTTLGELFEYNFPGAVTIKKNQSALLPFLQDSIAARKLLIYQKNDGEHPVNAVEISNHTGKTLDGGPITVFDAGAYAGEALVETVKTGDKRLIGYAVDYGTRITYAFGNSDNAVREVSAANGFLNIRVSQQRTRIYSIQNVDSKAKTIIIEQQGVNEYTVLSPTPLERTATAYRFEVDVPASGSKNLTVKQESIVGQTTAVTDAPNDVLFAFVQIKEISASGRRQLQAIVDLKTQIAESDAALASAKTRMQDLTEEQTRLRQNINSLNQVKGQEDQVCQYASRLSNNESALAKHRDESDAAAQQKQSLDAQLRRAIGKLEF